MPTNVTISVFHLNANKKPKYLLRTCAVYDIIIFLPFVWYDIFDFSNGLIHIFRSTEDKTKGPKMEILRPQAHLPAFRA